MIQTEKTVRPAGDRRPSGDCGERAANLVASHVLDVPDFPKPGILFKDLSPLFADGAALRGIGGSHRRSL